MHHTRSFTALVLTMLYSGAALHAAPVTIKGATFDAPAACQPAEGALVCKLDGQQFELFVNRKPLAPQVMPTDTFARKMVYFSDVHDTAVGNIMKSTDNDQATPFSSYGAHSALGSAMPGKGVPTSPAIRFASVLHDEEIWEFLEVVAKRTPAVDTLSNALQRSLALPAVASVPSTAGKAASEPTKSVAAPSSPSLKETDEISASAPKAGYPTFSGPLLSMQYPDFLEPVVIENTVSHFAVNFKDKTRTSGPNLMVSLRVRKGPQETAVIVVKARKDALTATMAGQSGSVDVNTLGDIKGNGFAFLGVPDAKKGLSGVESIETTFAADVPQGLLEVRLGAEQKYATDTQATWLLLAQSIKLAK